MIRQGERNCEIPSIRAAEDAARAGLLRRRAESTNLLVLGATASALGLGWMFGRGDTTTLPLLVLIPAAFVATAVVMTRRSNRIGIRIRGVGYVPVALLSVVAFPWIFLAANVIGALTVLSGGFALFGWKERCQRVWATAAAGAVLGVVTTAEPVGAFVPRVAHGGSVSVGVATAVFGVIAIAIGVLGHIAESDKLADVG
ncbi:hypothetical protein GS504_26910 [Rhodococcus hoagii]|uniref:Uncharacterized protein n=3 Tax=Rhodococcus hoagii TaxID=43767 RepID=F1TJQ9_RHOHA|nr:hypothetical protein [Prescottella equi]MCD7049209.1 hypothetical protein [Rhodococcus sp. BH2-1]EGD22363.1 hypothetical protein HMPREF0724_13962 [Prescottella equi ATCC 33707]MBM4479602.1 hypothetical protein [Prescottella equi]MBM4486880.1 hypothetical protein [Prescottella equi]MBM4500222.1 hypothetical protein [Prescottella equi]